jgi:hypothetical protein
MSLTQDSSVTPSGSNTDTGNTIVLNKTPMQAKQSIIDFTENSSVKRTRIDHFDKTIAGQNHFALDSIPSDCSETQNAKSCLRP